LAVLAFFLGVFLFYLLHNFLEERVVFHNFFAQESVANINNGVGGDNEIGAVVAENLQQFHDGREEN
jgi:hypothetical protein